MIFSMYLRFLRVTHNDLSLVTLDCILLKYMVIFFFNYNVVFNLIQLSDVFFFFYYIVIYDERKLNYN